VTIVTLVQHAEKGPIPGDPGLTPLGREQARRAAAALASLGVPAAVYSSPLKRALQTASAFAKQFDLQVQRDDRLRERINWDGDGSLESFLADWVRTTKDRDFVPASGDSSRQAAQRMLEALRDVANRHHDERVVVVTHGGVTVDVLRTLLGDEATASTVPDLLTAGVPCCGLTTLTRLSEIWFVNRIASVEHLG